MPAPKRGRACNACHFIKIKCELGSTSGGDPPCKRCLRLGRDCTISIPVRNKDRVAELEAKLEAMTRMLEAQNIGTGNGEGGGGRDMEHTTVSQNSSKKRRLEAVSPNENNLSQDRNEDSGEGVLEIDHLVSRAEQMVFFEKYSREMQPRFPLASLAAGRDYEFMLRKYPMLLQAIVYAADQGTLSMEVQADVTRIIMDLVAPDPIPEDRKSLELVQTIQIVTYYYRPPIHHIGVSLPHLINLSITIAKDLRIDRYIFPFSTGAPIKHSHIHPADAWRTWSTCYLFSASMGTGMRIPQSIPWTLDDEAKLMSIAYAKDGLPTDTLFCQFVRAERLCEIITTSTRFPSESSPTNNSNLEITIQSSLQNLQNAIIDWKAQIPSELNSPLLTLYEYLAVLSLHECVLHTPTNKSSFAGPYIAERLSVTDFPSPFSVTQEHVRSLNMLRDTAHALLNLYTEFDIEMIISLPVMITARALYAQMILVKLYISITAEGNSYGAFVDGGSLAVEAYLERMGGVAKGLAGRDEDGGHMKIMSSVRRMGEWVRKYDATRFEREFGGVGWDGFDVGVGNEGFLDGFEDLFGVILLKGGVRLGYVRRF